MDRSTRHHRASATRAAGIAAGACFVLALAGFGGALAGYDPLRHPVALPGAAGMPRALAFNLSAYVLPGLLASFVALRRRNGLASPAGVCARLGWTLALLAALAFAAQGLLPLDPAEPDAGPGRLHGVAWGTWGIAFAAATMALGMAALRTRRMAEGAMHLGAGVLVFCLGWFAGDALQVGYAQRLACVAWFLWLAWAATTRSRPSALAW